MQIAETVYEPVKPLGWSKKAVYEFASSVAERLLPEPGADPTSLVESFGGKVFYQNIFEAEGTKDGSILIEADGTFRIYLPDYVSLERNRFTLAHELGHYILHRLVPGRNSPLRASRTTGANSERAEWEANWFAAAFLMPEGKFRPLLPLAQNDLVAVARTFRVSLEAARYHKEFYEQSS